MAVPQRRHGRPGPSVDPVLPAGPSVGGGDLAGALFIRLQQLPGQFHQFGQLIDLANRAPWANPAKEQRLGLVDVADAGQVALVEQRLADGLARIGGQPADRLGCVPVRAEQIRAEVADGARFLTRAEDFDDAELAADRFIVPRWQAPA